ncbi:MAG: hypothetical protein CVU38_01735 [Chloroflexi bacterium HGW-Chloroflexi-1]|nr:MAG: hypothetical protein CVU38_01735 [Chloroflexi bacterium HGW-Chloroflexi-1]
MNAHFLAQDGRAEAAIVVGRDAGAFYRWVAGELQRYLQQLSGAELPVVANDQAPAQKPLVIVGGPQANPLAALAQEKQLVSFAGLKSDGFVLQRTELGGVPVVLLGGNDEAATMYAAYEFLERLGIVFQLTNDIIPQQKPDLALPLLEVRMAPTLKYRGLHCCHGLRWYMGLEDFRKHIDQMAKLKLNCLHFYFGIGGSPWLEFSYGGKVAEIFYPEESGYLAWGGPGLSTLNVSGTADDVRVGRECFPGKYLGAPEFADVRTPEQAFATAREFLHEIMRYAQQRKVQVWLMLGEIPRVPPNLVPAGVESPKGFEGLFYCGRLLPHGHPAMLDIWESALQSMIETYPEADGYGVWTAEDRPSTNYPETQQLMGKYAAVRKLIPSAEEIQRHGNFHVDSNILQGSAGGLESDFAEVCATAEIVRRIKARYPDVKFGVATLFRGYLLHALDSLLPEDVWLMNMENCQNFEPVMHFYGGIAGRELLVMPRIDDDGCELHLQLNASVYERDEIIPGAARYGLAGIVGQLNKERGLECNVRFIADGAWNPQINPRSFYKEYLPRVFGPDACETLLKAYLIMDELEINIGAHVPDGLYDIFIGFNRFQPVWFPLRTSALQEAQPKLQPQDVEKEISNALRLRERLMNMAVRYQQALELLQQASSSVLPGARAELDYVIFKTKNFADYLDVLAAGYKVVEAVDRALLARIKGNEIELLKELEQAQAAADRADRLAHAVARQMIPFAHIPTEKYLLFRFNQNVISWTEKARAELARVIMNQGHRLARQALDSATVKATLRGRSRNA